MGTDCKSAAFQLRWFESTRAHKKTVSVEIRWRFSVCRRFGFSCGWIRTAAALSQKTAQKQPSGLFLAARLAQSTRAHQELRYPMGTGVSVLSALKKGMQGWIRTAAEPTAACGGNREARLGQRSAFSKPCQGAAEKAASATRKTRRIVRREKKPLCNSDDRCQRQKQGGAVGAAASRMRVPPKARCNRREPRPGFLFCAARDIRPHTYCICF